MEKIFHGQDISRKRHFIDKTFEGQNITSSRHFMDKTFHEKDILRTRYFFTKNFHGLNISWLGIYGQDITWIKHFMAWHFMVKTLHG